MVVDTPILPPRFVISDGLSAAVPRVELLELEELFIHTIYETRARDITVGWVQLFTCNTDGFYMHLCDRPTDIPPPTTLDDWSLC